MDLLVRLPKGDAGSAGEVGLDAAVDVPLDPSGVVVFAHGSGSSRHSPRNRHVAAVLQAGGMATVLADLLTATEERLDLRPGSGGRLRFDIPLLAGRVVGLLDWLAADHPDGTLPDPTPSGLKTLPVGLFGASTGAAAALVAAAGRPNQVRAVVSRGGRPDLAGDALGLIRAPTLLIVGGNDRQVLELNRHALALLGTKGHLEVVPGATHLFEEPGTLEQVAALARDWFLRHLPPAAPPATPTGPATGLSPT